MFDEAYKKAGEQAMILTKDISLKRASLREDGLHSSHWTTLPSGLNVTLTVLSHPMRHLYNSTSLPTPTMPSWANATGVDYLVTDKKGYSFVTQCLARNFKNDCVKLNTVVTAVHTA